MFSKNPLKEQMRLLIQAQIEESMLLDSSICNRFAPQPLPPKPKYRRAKVQPDAFQRELEGLLSGSVPPLTPSAAVPPVDLGGDLDIEKLEQDAKAFMSKRKRK